MPEGVKVDRMAVVVAQWPAGTQPAGAYTNVDSVADRVTRVAVYKGEALVPGRLAPEGTGAGLEVKITPGKRAYGIRINDVASLAGMVQPNSRVDIMVVIDDPENAGKSTAKLFMSNMRVLAIGAAPERAQDGRPISAARRLDRGHAGARPRGWRSPPRRARCSSCCAATATRTASAPTAPTPATCSPTSSARAPSRCRDAKRRNRAAPRNDRQLRHRVSHHSPPPVVQAPPPEAGATRLVQRQGVPRNERNGSQVPEGFGCEARLLEDAVSACALGVKHIPNLITSQGALA